MTCRWDTTGVSACPSTNTIADLVCRQLPAARSLEVEAHVADCSTCRRIVGTLAAASLPSLASGSIASGAIADAPDAFAGGPHSERYVVRQELARGGMGRISIAEDTLLHRTVAIKQLLSPSPALVARFQHELALTARLQHPSIVSVHDGGTGPDGDPFYVMRLVSGEPLDRAIARCADVPARLGLLAHGIAMVDAVAYAHSQGIVHRDLKPANVLVGEFGETVVIDWGLAKDLRDPGDAARELVIGTPSYMPPEQARGERADERSDIYALGAVLYHVLAGSPPYSGGSATQIVNAVIAGPPAPLVDRAAAIPPDLLAIVAKAMARDPSDRYPTAANLAADLKRFQRGQLVGAHRYSNWQLVRRWVARHRAAVVVAAIALVVVAAGATIGIRRVLDARQAAERDRGNAEELIRFMMTDLHDKLHSIGKLDLLDVVARKARDYYDRRPPDDGTGAVRARTEMAQVMDERGDHAGARTELLAADEQIDNQLARMPGDPEWQRLSSATHRHVGETLEQEGRTSDALTEYRLALAADERRDFTDPHVLLALAQSHGSIGRVLGDQGDTGGALAELRTSEALAETGAAHLPAADDAQRTLYLCHINLGAAFEASGAGRDALAEYRRAASISKARVERAPGDSEAQRDQFLSEITLGHLLVQQGEVATGIAQMRAAGAISEQLAAREPSNLVWQRDYSGSQNDLGNVLLEQGDVAGALAAFRAGQRAIARVALQSPTDLGVRRDVAVSASRVAEALFEQHDLAGALREFQAALASTEAAAALDPTHAGVQGELAIAHYEVGRAQGANGDLVAALAEFRIARELASQVVARDPTSMDGRNWLALATESIGDVLAEQHDVSGAIEQYRAAATIADELLARDPGDTRSQSTRDQVHEKLSAAERTARPDRGHGGHARE
jgi:tetratricopeptide (TPR) repeat protein